MALFTDAVRLQPAAGTEAGSAYCCTIPTQGIWKGPAISEKAAVCRVGTRGPSQLRRSEKMYSSSRSANQKAYNSSRSSANDTAIMCPDNYERSKNRKKCLSSFKRRILPTFLTPLDNPHPYAAQ